jgi:hypothetical protein
VDLEEEEGEPQNDNAGQVCDHNLRMRELIFEKGG